ncbi:MAG: LysR family transcriptional regulator [Geminicoccaceae bacterium]
MTMRTPRRFLPSLSLLTAFEAVARTGSITAAAEELSLTQGAVSRQVRALEEQLGAALFVRERQRVRPTVAGAAYAREIRDALRKISGASLNLRANPAGGTLTLAILPTFGTRWLAPRLPRFLAANPGVTINLTTRLAPFDFRLEPVDAAIHFGRDDWPGGEMVRLRSEQVIPVCSPRLKEELAPARPEDLRPAPLLHLATRPDAWERWFAANGVAAEGVHGMLLDQFAMVTQATIAGLGLALLPDFLIKEELARGTLVTALDRPLRSEGAYWLVWPVDRADHPPLAAFRAWLVGEAAEG